MSARDGLVLKHSTIYRLKSCREISRCDQCGLEHGSELPLNLNTHVLASSGTVVPPLCSFGLYQREQGCLCFLEQKLAVTTTTFLPSTRFHRSTNSLAGCIRSSRSAGGGCVSKYCSVEKPSCGVTVPDAGARGAIYVELLLEGL